MSELNAGNALQDPPTPPLTPQNRLKPYSMMVYGFYATRADAFGRTGLLFEFLFGGRRIFRGFNLPPDSSLKKIPDLSLQSTYNKKPQHTSAENAMAKIG